MEEGHSGRIGILTVMALYLGEPNDHVPTPWEAMLLPSVLRDGVAERFGAAPEKLADRLGVVLPGSRAVGRIVVFLLAFLLFGVARYCARRNRMTLAKTFVGGSLGLLAVSIELATFAVTWPEVTHNWSLLLFWPTDLALPYLTGRRLTLYLKARLATAGVFAALAMVNLVHQPMLPLVALVLLPMSAILFSMKAMRPASEPRLSRTSKVIGDT
jgi:hypothetical protein